MATFFMRIWGGITAGVRWLWSRPVLLAGIVGALIGAFFVVRSKKNQINNLKDAVEAQRIKSSVARKEAQAEALVAKAEASEQELHKLKQDIVRSKQRVAELAHGRDLEGVPDDEIARLFSDSGL